MVLVFEFLGVNLYRRMRMPNFKHFSNLELKTLTRQAMNSLKYLKEVVGVIHCDLKPENILFTDEKCDTIKVIHHVNHFIDH